MIVPLSMYYLGDKVKQDKTGERCEKCVQGCYGKSEGTEHLEDLGVEGNIIVKLILNKRDRRVWIAFIWLRYEQVAGSCKDDSESCGSITCGDYPE